jgi:hypothetical protein
MSRTPQLAGPSSDYLATILDPDRVRGIKLPDPITLPSCTAAFELDGFTTCDANGDLILVLCPQALVNSAATGTAAISYSVIFGGNQTAGYGTSANPVLGLATNPTLNGVVGQLRVVSAMIEAYSTAAPLNTSGRAVTFAMPRGSATPTGTTLSSATLVSALPYSFVDHAAKGACARWFPTDNVDHQYNAVGGTTEENFAQASSGSFYGFATGVYALGSCVGIGFTGLPVTTKVAWRYVINVEFLPAADAVDFVNSQPSPSEPSSLALANSWLQKNAQTLLRSGGQLLGGALDTVFPGLGSIPRAIGQVIGGAMHSPNIGQQMGAQGRISGSTLSALRSQGYLR